MCPLDTKPDISELKQTENIDALTTILFLPNEPQSRTQAIQALHDIGSPKAITSIVKALKQSYFYDVRVFAASVLSDFDLWEVKEALTDALSDPIEEVSLNAAFSLAKLGDIKAKEILLNAKYSKNTETSKIALDALNYIETRTKSHPQDTKITKKPVQSENLTPFFNDKGVDLVNTGKYEEALKYFDKALKIDEKYTSAWFNKAMVLEKKGLFSEAINCYEAVQQLVPKDEMALFKIASLKDALGETNEAIHLYQVFLKRKNYQMSTEISFARERLKELGVSKRNEIKEHDIKLSEELRNKADCLDIAGETKAAIATYDQAIKKNPENVDAWYNKGLTLDRKGNPSDALTCFKRVLEITPEDAGAWYNKARQEEKLGFKLAAVKSFKQFISFSNREMKTEIKHATQRLKDLSS